MFNQGRTILCTRWREKWEAISCDGWIEGKRWWKISGKSTFHHTWLLSTNFLIPLTPNSDTSTSASRRYVIHGCLRAWIPLTWIRDPSTGLQRRCVLHGCLRASWQMPIRQNELELSLNFCCMWQTVTNFSTVLLRVIKPGFLARLLKPSVSPMEWHHSLYPTKPRKENPNLNTRKWY